ncbi:MAG: hypothetical protein PHG81_06530 [Aliarcobacter sp.]|nr:hypothetical protein [Aliarcobacter sp.]
MKIYIYGNQSFKKEIHETLEHSNIKFKLDSDTVIEEINSLIKLKETIKNNPTDIYLIDDEKIIKKNSLNKRIKFLTPKDGIEEEYLLDSGIADLSIDSLSELPKYIIKRYEELKLLEPKEIESEENKIEDIEQNDIELDDELAQLLSKGDRKKQDLTPIDDLDDIFGIEKDINLDDIEDIIGNTDKNELKKVNEFDDLVNFNDNFGLNNISYDYDDNDVLYKEESDEDLSDSTPKESIDIFKELDFLGEEVEEDEEEIMDLEKINNDLFGGFDFLNEEIQEGKKVAEEVVEEEIDTIESNPFGDFDFLNDEIDEDKEIKEDNKFDKEDEETLDDDLFSEFDFSKEEKIQSGKNSESVQGAKMSEDFFELDSLNEKDLLEALSYNVGESNSTSEFKPTVSETRNETLSIDSSNVNDLSLLISKLLNNKTLEITIKIKD